MNEGIPSDEAERIRAFLGANTLFMIAPTDPKKPTFEEFLVEETDGQTNKANN